MSSSQIARGLRANGIGVPVRVEPQAPAEPFPSHAIPVELAATELVVSAVAAAAVLVGAAMLVRKTVRSIYQ